MNGDDMALIVVSVLALAVILTSHLRHRAQQRTIDRLTDKLMARDYREYVGLKREGEIDVSPPQEQEEKKGWFDH